MSTKVTTAPTAFPSFHCGWDQYSAGKLVPSFRQSTSVSTCVLPPLPKCLENAALLHRIGLSRPHGNDESGRACSSRAVRLDVHTPEGEDRPDCRTCSGREDRPHKWLRPLNPAGDGACLRFPPAPLPPACDRLMSRVTPWTATILPDSSYIPLKVTSVHTVEPSLRSISNSRLPAWTRRPAFAAATTSSSLLLATAKRGGRQDVVNRQSA